jgi:hypothetical protein
VVTVDVDGPLKGQQQKQKQKTKKKQRKYIKQGDTFLVFYIEKALKLLLLLFGRVSF